MTPVRIDPIRPVRVALALLLIVLASCGEPTGSGSDSDRPRGEGLNVLLVSLDTTRADRLGAYGQPESPTPRIDRLAAEGVLFEQCVAPAPITLPSHASLMTATDPFVHGVRYNGYVLGQGSETLAEALHQRDYATAAEIGAYVLNAEYGLDQGFDDYRDVGDDRLERGAAEVADAAIERLRALGPAEEPFFLFVHFFDPHEPYAAPAPWAGRHSTPYLDEIAYADEQVGRLLDELDALGLRDSTLVVLLGDHGESLGEHGEDTHSFFVYDATTAVPLILRAPDRLPQGLRVGSQVRLIDVAPTILAFVGARELSGAQGLSLLPALADPPLDLVLPAYSESFYPRHAFGYSQLRSLRVGGWKYIHAPGPELYRLDDDPGESDNLAGTEVERVERMRGALRRWIGEAPESKAGPDDQPGISAEQLERLQSLGYIGGATSSVTAGSELESFDPQGPDPKDRIEVMALSARAVILDRDGRRDEAEQMLRRVIAIAPDGGAELAAVHGLLAKILAATGRHEEAVEHYRERLASGWNPGDTRAQLGTELVRLGRVDEAIREFETAIGEGPVSAAIRVNYGSALMAAKRPAEAVEQYRQALEVDPELAAARVNLGAGLVATGRVEEAEAVYREVIARSPDSAAARRALAELMIAGHRAEDALEQYTELSRLTPDDARVQRGLGLSYLQLDRAEDAVGPLERSVELDPASARAWYSLSAAHAAAGRLDRAVAAAERAAQAAERAGQNAFAARIRQRVTELRRAEAPVGPGT